MNLNTYNLSCSVNQSLQLQRFIQQNHLRPGDAIIVKEYNRGIIRNLADHYIVYLGDTLFMANYRKGVEILDCPTIFGFLPSMRVDRIRRFKGHDLDRQKAVKRALAQRNQKNYHLILQNCEHFANKVQSGVAFSNQTLLASTAVATAGLVLMNKDNDLGKLVGGVLLLLGGAFATAELAKRT